MQVKPDDIPRDVWDNTQRFLRLDLRDGPAFFVEIARAILAERERADLRVKQLEDVLMEARLLLTPLGRNRGHKW